MNSKAQSSGYVQNRGYDLRPVFERPDVLREMGDQTLKNLAMELTEKLRSSTTVDWQERESVRARMRILIRRLLRMFKYPPDGYEEATALVLKQTEALANSWTV